MSTVSQQVVYPEVSEDTIADYLRSHPDFFERNLQLLSALKLTHRTTGGAISLVERQLDVLRQRNGAVEGKLHELVEVARSNDRLAGRIHALALMLMRSKSRENVIDILDEQLREGFSVDQAALVLFDSVPGLVQGHSRFVTIVNREDPAVGPFKSFLQSSAPRCTRVRDAQRDFLFGAASTMQSMALVPIGPRSEYGFVAIGSRDPDHFQPAKSSDFLQRLGELIACALSLH
ncbi:MAG: DUF484 family protein [Gammaproteobacteria bacterium]|nr:DUF484 family protein [Gammaproteobacteria bacterium]